MKKDLRISEFILKCLKDPTLLTALKKDPKKLIEKELNIQLPESYQLEVVQETSQKAYIVLPPMEFVHEYSEEELQVIAAGGEPTGYTITFGCGSCVQSTRK